MSQRGKDSPHGDPGVTSPDLVVERAEEVTQGMLPKGSVL